MPSKTLAHAYKGTTTPLEFGLPYNKMNEYANVKFLESKGAALAPAREAFFGKARLARDRIHWVFSPENDERVVSLLGWIEATSYGLGAFGLHKFLQSRERGALFTNAEFRMEGSPLEPAFDWLTFDELQLSKDKILQESVTSYDPSKVCIVFVFLPSQSGNSVAIWRRKINVPNNTRMMLNQEINLCMTGLRRDSEYVVHVDE
ncbi:hypothetical protein C8J56DRAFT_1003846 [Mycena floridula]|nr:hypothetical protein C8J56DRAFT_1003846 [Mycena floridula]